jgi:hypothetical protein
MSILTHIALFKMEIIYIYRERERQRASREVYTSYQFGICTHLTHYLYYVFVYINLYGLYLA